MSSVSIIEFSYAEKLPAQLLSDSNATLNKEIAAPTVNDALDRLIKREYNDSGNYFTYSSHTGVQYKKHPGITQAEIKCKLQRIGKIERFAESAVTFSLDSIRAALPV